MSDSETRGRCRSDIDKCLSRHNLFSSQAVLADGIDRLAAELGDVKEMVREIALQGPSEFGRDACDVAVRAAKIERDAARADVERLKAELAARPAAAAWLTEVERRILAGHVKSLREQRFALERGGLSVGYSMNPCAIKHEADTIDAILARAGSPPVVEVPVMPAVVVDRLIHIQYRDALDKAGVQWKEVPRE